MFDPELVNSASDLPQPLPYREEGKQRLELGWRSPFEWNFNWLRQPSSGILEGELGLVLRTAGEVSAIGVIEGVFQKELALEERGRLRLRLNVKSETSVGPAIALKVTAIPAASLPDKPEELLAAVLGTHFQQWLRYWSEKVRTAPDALVRLLPECAPATVKRFFEFWDGLDAGEIPRLWDAAPDAAALERVSAGVGLDDALREVLIHLKTYFAALPTVQDLMSRVRSLSDYRALDEWLRSQIERRLGPVNSERDWMRLLERLTRLGGLRDAVYEKAKEALQKKYEAELAWRLRGAGQQSALVECSFAFTERGLALFRRAWRGDFSWMASEGGEDFEIRSGLFGSQLSRETRLELHLPFLDRKGWSSRLESLANVEVTSDADGRLFVYHVEASHRREQKNAYQSLLALAGTLNVGRLRSTADFSLSYTDSRRLQQPQDLTGLLAVLGHYNFGAADMEVVRWQAEASRGDLEASLVISVPGSLASAWLEAPEERSPEFFPAYSRVSIAVQRAMRTWLPYHYFCDLGRYGDLAAAFPLVVYQASPPYPGRPRYDFNYDVMSASSMEEFYRLAARRLPQQLADIEQVLRNNGAPAVAGFYSPRRARDLLDSVRQRPQLLHALLAGDAFLTDALINLGCRGAELRKILAANPAEGVRKLTRYAAEFVKAFHGRLRRLYGKQDFLALGSLLLVEATAALRGEPPASAPRAMLRLTGGTAPTGAAVVLLNPAWRESGQ
ncbi:MAG: hypothetical protein ACUVXB_07680 [Bryobacteraceae bacterium]